MGRVLSLQVVEALRRTEGEHAEGASQESEGPRQQGQRGQQGQHERQLDPSGYEWQVLEFRRAAGGNGGGAAPSVRAVTATPEFLGLSPRDVSLFAATAGAPHRRACTPAVPGRTAHWLACHGPRSAWSLCRQDT